MISQFINTKENKKKVVDAILSYEIIFLLRNRNNLNFMKRRGIIIGENEAKNGAKKVTAYMK